MPNYRVIPFHHYSKFIHENLGLTPEISGDYIELLPGWMSVLKRIDPSKTLTSIKFHSNDTDLDDFISHLKQKISSFEYRRKDNEWVSFVVSPISIQSKKSSWSNEITYWSSYSKMDNEIISDFEFSFETPDGFLRQVSRRARSWDYLHHVHPKKDLAVQLFSSHEITPTIKQIDQIHENNVKGQLVLWTCGKDEIEKIAKIVAEHELTIKLVEENSTGWLIAITTHFFDPFIGLYSMPMDWDSFEKGNVKNKMIQNNLIDKIPGSEYTGEIPTFLAEALNRHSNKKYEKVIITEMEYIPGFPLILNERLIQVSRFQMISEEEAKSIEEKIECIQPLKLKNYHIEFGLKDDSMWETSIYELHLSWTPEIRMSSKESFNKNEEIILTLFNEILPTNEDKSVQLKNTYEILHIAGEIGFEKNEG